MEKIIRRLRKEIKEAKSKRGDTHFELFCDGVKFTCDRIEGKADMTVFGAAATMADSIWAGGLILQRSVRKVGPSGRRR